LPPEPQAAAAGAAGAAAAPAKAVDPAQDEHGGAPDEQRKAAVDKDNLLIEALHSRINALQADVVNIDDPVQQGKPARTLAKR
jgi:hypothetical protein